MSIRKRWLVFAITGLILVGAGFSVAGHAIVLKSAGSSVKQWFLLGTGGLVLFNAGLSLFGQGVVYRSRL